MKRFFGKVQLFFAALAVLGAVSPTFSQDGVVINEIMFHPVLHTPQEEFIEIHNRSAVGVNLAGWRLDRGVDFVFPAGASVAAGGYLVIAADTNVFRAMHPGITNVIGNWSGTLKNSGQTVRLVNGAGQEVDSVTYADEGDWAVRRRGVLDRNHRGWEWFSEADGLGKSLELRNAAMPNEHGQNWGVSVALGGTPGRENSIATNDIPPLILDVAHFPPVPSSTNSVRVVARVIDEVSPAGEVVLFYRIDGTNPPPATEVRMFDDGLHQDGTAGDSIYGATIPPATNDAVVEFYIGVKNGSGGLLATYPRPAVAEDGTNYVQGANLLFQVDDRAAGTQQPLYKLILREEERAELALIGSTSIDAQSDAQMNGTFISIDGTGTEVRYQVGIRNRGHGSRDRKPNNYRVNFRSDDTWKGVRAINLNGQYSYLQHIGAVLAFQAGVAGAYSTPAQVRVNNLDLSLSGGLNRTYGSYVANESLNGDWADVHFPNDSGGNIYRAIRDLAPADLGYRGTNWQSYTNSYFKASNEGENDWADLIRLTDVLTNAPDADYERAVREVVNVEQWLRHLAVMALFDSQETGLNTGHGDDYFMYRGEVDQRFQLLFYDLDTILGLTTSTNSTIFAATAMPAFSRFLTHFRTNYFVVMDELLNTTFAKPQFDAVVEQTLGSYVPQNIVAYIKSWMDGRREYVRALIAPSLPAKLPVATIRGIPRERTPLRTATVRVGGEGVTHYKFQVNEGVVSGEREVGSAIELQNLVNGMYTVRVWGRNAAGEWQAEPTVSGSWTVDGSWPAVRINEVLASNRTAAPRDNGFPDLIELYNESNVAVSLAGYSLGKGANGGASYFFQANTTIPAGGFVVLTATDAAASASNTGFTLDAGGDSLVLRTPGTGTASFVADSLTFGRQLADFSIGRVEGGEWELTRVSFGAANSPEAVAAASAVVINEWLGAPEVGSAEFVELFNTDALPVNIGGLYLTDQPIGWPDQQRITPLTFIPGRGFYVFSGSRIDAELGFGLSASAGEIALMRGEGERVDSVAYTAERGGMSSGRTPDGANRFAPFSQPTPGGPNSRPDLPQTAQLVTFIPMGHTWKYDQSGSNLGTDWRGTNFNDASWSSGPALLGKEDSVLTEPIRTELSLSSSKRTFYFRTKFFVDPSIVVSGLQVSHFIDDGAVFYLNGQEIGARYNMPVGAVAYDTLAIDDVSNARIQGPFLWPVNLLRAGENTLAVEVHQYRANSTDVVFGLSLEGLVLTNNAAEEGVRLNEILTQNTNLREPDGSTPDWIELYNPSTNDVDLGGLALSDDAAVARKWVFPAGSIIGAGEYFAVMCDRSKAASETNTGFALKGSGGAVFLYGTVADGGQLLDSIRYGLLPQDFSLGRSEEGTWVLNLPTIGRENTAANLGPQSALRINEWLADPPGGEDDWFELFNSSALPVDLSGLLLSDEPAAPGKFTIAARSYVGVGGDGFVQFIADNNVENGPEHTSFRLSSASDYVVLSRADGVTIDAISFANLTSGISEGRLPDGATQIVRFSDSVSPGHPNYVTLSNIWVNEVLAHSDPPLEDAVELLNGTGTAVDLSGWYLSDDEDEPKKFVIPAGTLLGPGGFKVFYEYQFNPLPGDPRSFSFSSAKGDSVILSEVGAGGALTGRRVVARFGASESGVSLGRVQTSSGIDYAPLRARTFGRDLPQSVQEFRQGTGGVNAAPRVGPIIVSELMYQPPLLGTNDNVRDEFFELQNISGASVLLYDAARPTNRWRLRGGIEFDFPAVSIPAGGTLVVVSFNPQNDAAALGAFRERYGTTVVPVGPYIGKLGNEDDVVELLKPDEPTAETGEVAGEVPYVLVEKVDYARSAPWPTGAAGSGLSLHRRFSGEWLYANEALNWVAQAATPGVREGASAADQDGDGMNDDWERANGLNPLDGSDGVADADGDGLSNLAEFRLGTNPRDATSSFTAEVRRGGGGYLLVFMARSERAFSVQARDDVGGGVPWVEVADVPAGVEREVSVPLQTTGRSRFYRVVVE